MKNSFSKFDWPAIRTRKIFTRNDLSSLKKESECDKQQSIGSDHAAIASPEEKQLHCDSNTISSSSAPLVDKGRQKALPLNKRKKRHKVCILGVWTVHFGKLKTEIDLGIRLQTLVCQ